MASLAAEAGDESTEFDPGVLHRFGQFVDGAAVVTVCLAATVLAGWLGRVPLLISVLPGTVSMKPTTAVCLLALGVAVWCSRDGRSPRCRRVGAGAAVLVGFLAAVVLVEYLARIDLGLDLLLFGDDPAVALSAHPGRMAPNTAAALLMLGAAQLALLGDAGRCVVAGQLLSLGAGALGILGLYGYAYGVPEFQSPLGLTGMALPTAVGVTVAAVATFVARPTAGLARMLAGRARSAMMTRRMLAATPLVAPTVGWLRLIGESRGLYGARLGMALLVAANVAFLMTFACVTGARAVRLEIARSRAEGALAWHSAAAAMAEAAPDAMIGVAADGVIILVNAQAERMFGYRRDEMLGRSVEMLVPGGVHGDHPAAYPRDPRVRPIGSGLAQRARHRDGTEIPVEISVSALETQERRVVVAAVHDVAERIRFERQLREQNVQLERANEAKDAFLAAMSHELRTPLNAIIGFTGILLMGLPGRLNAEQTHQLRLVEASGQHLLSLINDVLDLAKIEAGRAEVVPESVDCAAAVREIAASLRPQAQSKGVGLITELPAGPCVAMVDRRALDQIIINLVGNAIKFTTEGEVRVSLTRVHPTAPWVLTVSDTGPGIDPADQARVFDAFHRTREARARGADGAGLGLYISHTLAELMGCQMRLTSRPGDGSAFTLTLAA
jgi:PAS domain S-box-containing protein